MKIVIGSDKSGFSLKEAVKKHLIDAGHMVEDCGTADLDHVKPFFETAPILAEKMQTGEFDRGVLICGTGAGMAIVGAAVLSLQSDFSMGIGDLMTLACAVCFALQIFLTGEFVGKIRPTVLNFLQMTTAFVLSGVGLIVTGSFRFKPSMESLLAVLYLGIVSTTITYLLQTISQKYVDETKSAIILSMEAVFGTIFSVILLHETVTVRMITGSVLILAAVLVSEVSFSKKTNK